MIKAVFFRSDEEKLRLCINGHAPKECGCVCAAVSGIFFSLTGYLIDRLGDKVIINRIRSGQADIECPEDGKEAFRMACIGFLQVAEQYPGSIEVECNIWQSELCALPKLKELEI